MTPSGIEPATFRFVAQHLNHFAPAVPTYTWYGLQFRANIDENVRFEALTEVLPKIQTFLDTNMCCDQYDIPKLAQCHIVTSCSPTWLK